MSWNHVWTNPSRRVNPGWLTARDVARLVGVTTRTVRAWVARGELPEHRSPTGRHLFKGADVERLIEAGRRAPPL